MNSPFLDNRPDYVPGPSNLHPYNLPGIPGVLSANYDLKDPDEALSYSMLKQTGTMDQLLKKLSQQATAGAGQVKTSFGQFLPQLQQNFSQFAPNINTNFTARPELDAFSQRLLAQGQQDVSNRLAANQASIRDRLGVTNPAAAVLQEQAASRATLNSNPLLMQVAAAQQQRQASEQQMSNQAIMAQAQERSRLQGLGNEAALAQMTAGANLQNMGNQALAQRLQMQAIPSANQQNLLSMLQSMAKQV